MLCGNKVDINNRAVSIAYQNNGWYVWPRLAGNIDSLQYYDISAKSNFNCEKPFLWLARQLLNDESLMFMESPASDPVMDG